MGAGASASVGREFDLQGGTGYGAYEAMARERGAFPVDVMGAAALDDTSLEEFGVVSAEHRQLLLGAIKQRACLR